MKKNFDDIGLLESLITVNDGQDVVEQIDDFLSPIQPTIDGKV